MLKLTQDCIQEFTQGYIPLIPLTFHYLFSEEDPLQNPRPPELRKNSQVTHIPYKTSIFTTKVVAKGYIS